MVKPILSKFLGAAWKVLLAVNLSVIFLILYPVAYLLIRHKSTFPLAFRLKKLWAKLSLLSVGVMISIKQEEILNGKQAYVFCSNHTSYIDILIALAAIPQYFHFMGKAELKKIPLFGQFFKDMDIAVDRDNRAASYKAFLKAGNDIDENKSILIFPEATFSDHPPVMRPFKNGAFKLAIEKQIPVVPVTFLNSWHLLPSSDDSSGGRPGIARVIIHKPVETAGLTEKDISMLKQKVFEIIEGPLKINPNQVSN